MFYCFFHPESIEKILEQTFRRVPFEYSAEVCKYEKCFSFKSDTLKIFIGNSNYQLQDPNFILDNLIRKVELEGSKYVNILELEREVIYKDEEITAEVEKQDSIEFFVFKSSSNGKKLGAFIECLERSKEKILIEYLKKYEITLLEENCSRELSIIKLLAKLNKF